MSRGGGAGLKSSSAVARSTPEIPSTSAWCVLKIIAKRSVSDPLAGSIPSTSQNSHNGLVRSSGCDAMRAAISSSCGSLPGAGSAEWRTWYSMLKLVSSTHSGRPVPPGGVASFWR